MMLLHRKNNDLFRSVISFPSSLGIHYLFFLLPELLAFANVSGDSYNTLNVHQHNKVNSYLRASLDVISFENWNQANSLVGNQNKTSTITEKCIQAQHQERLIKYYHMNSIAHLDRRNQNDIVQNQYTLLPYPAVTLEDIEDMKQYYNGNRRHLPLTTHYVLTLERINHYLYAGKNNFM